MLPTLAFLLALVENDPIKLAESHYEAGRSAYERGAWDVALIEFEAAFDLTTLCTSSRVHLLTAGLGFLGLVDERDRAVLDFLDGF